MMVIKAEDLVQYFETSAKFGSLFIVSDTNNQNRVVCEIKQINQGQEQISFIPLSEDERFAFSGGQEVCFINEANNVSFKTRVLAIHNKSWLTLTLPSEVKIVNLRAIPRSTFPQKHLQGTSKIISFGEEGVRPLMNHEGRVLDISESGASFEVLASSLSGYYKGDHVEIMISEKFPFLSQVKGKVVHKTIGNMMNKEQRSYKIGVKFNKKVNLSPLELS